MSPVPRRLGLWLLAVALATSITPAEAQRERSYRTLSSARQVLDEQDVTVRVRFALGHFAFGPDQGGALYRTTLVYDENLFEPVQHYDRERHTLDINISDDSKKNNFNARDFGQLRDLRQRLDVAVSPVVPTHVDLEFGVVRAEIDLGGMSLADADIETGASEGLLQFSRPTLAPCKRLHVVMGAADFDAVGLGNANCAEMEFEGAAGSFTLDFTGEWQREGTTSAKVDLGVGSLNLRFPSHLGVAVSLDRFLATFERTGFTKRGDVYYSSNYDNAAAKLRLDISAAFGDINVEWTR
jgi:hypothetical protein